jgi:hypothetical protein
MKTSNLLAHYILRLPKSSGIGKIPTLELKFSVCHIQILEEFLDFGKFDMPAGFLLTDA